MPKVVDWSEIRLAYITSIKSYRQIAKDHKVPIGSVQKIGKEENWPALRQEYREKAAMIAIENEVNNEAERLSKIIKAANAMSDVIEGIFKDKDQFYRHLVQDEVYDPDSDCPVKTTEERIFKKVDSRAIRDLTGSLKDMTMVLRNLYNLPTQAEAEAQRIASERLKIEQMKANAENNVDKRIEVILSADMEEFAK